MSTYTDTPFCGYAAHTEYYKFQIAYLLRERQKIARRGRLTAEQDTRLYEIDDEVAKLEQCLEKAMDK